MGMGICSSWQMAVVAVGLIVELMLRSQAAVLKHSRSEQEMAWRGMALGLLERNALMNLAWVVPTSLMLP